MGVSLEAYRASIGCFNCIRVKQSFALTPIQLDISESDHPPPILFILRLCSWKLTYLVLLSVFTNFIAIHAA